MGALGGALKRKEKLSARLGDMLSLLYLCSATLKRYEDEGRQAADAPLMHWAIWDAMFKAQSAFEGVISNFPNRVDRARCMRAHRVPARAGRTSCRPTSSATRSRSLLIEPSATRDRLTAGMYIAERRRRSGGADRARARGDASRPSRSRRKLRAAQKDGTLDGSCRPAQASTCWLRARGRGRDQRRRGARAGRAARRCVRDR